MHIETTTPDNAPYEYHPLPQPTITFKVMASNDAHIILSEYDNPSSSEPVIEIFIGGWNNTMSVIRLNHVVNEAANTRTEGILNSEEFRGFWITVEDNSVVSVGRENETTPFMTSVNPKPFRVNYFGVRTGHGATGEWRINGEPISTDDELHYKKYFPMPSYSLAFHVRAANDAHIALTSALGDTNPMYEVFVGGWENKQSGIRFNQTETNDEPRKDTPSVLSADEFRLFLLSWKNGLVELKNSEGQLLVHGRASELVSVTHFGVRTCNGATGKWVIEAQLD